MRNSTILSILFSLLVVTLIAGCPDSSGDDDDDDNDVGPGDPTLVSTEPDSGAVGQTVRINGTDFGSQAGTVGFGIGQATVIAWTDTAIDFEVPDHIPGSYDVSVSVSGKTSNTLAFGLVLPRAVYVNNSPNNQPATVAAWTVDAAGGLTPMSGAPFATGMMGGPFSGDSNSIQIHEATRRLFVSGDDAVSVFDIDPRTGALAAVTGSPFSANTGLQVFGLAVTSDGSLVYGANMSEVGVEATSFISIFEVRADGSLTHHATSPRDTGVSSRADIAMLTPDDGYLFVNTEDGEFLGYTVGGDGSLSVLSGSPFLVDPMARTYGGRIHPDGRALYLPETALNNEGVLVYSIDRLTGAPTLDPDSPHAAINASGVAFANDGARLYTATFNANTLYGFDIATDGDLTALGTSPYTLNVSSTAGLAVSRDGTLLVVVDFQADQVGVYDVATDGTVTETSGSPYSNGNTTNGTGVALTF